MAVKSLSKEKMQSSSSDFLKEAANMQQVDHEHIVRLYGVVLSNDNMMLVSNVRFANLMGSANLMGFAHVMVISILETLCAHCQAVWCSGAQQR